MAALFKKAGLNISLGRFSIRINDCHHFVFQQYGDGIPGVDAGARSLEEMMRDARLVSNALAANGIRHRFSIYGDDDECVGCVYFRLPPT
jgi:hypothetical protein